MIIKTEYKCRLCGHISNSEEEAYEHLNESSEEDKIYQEGYEQECDAFYETSHHDFSLNN